MTLRMQFQGTAASDTPMARFSWERAASIWADVTEKAVLEGLKAKAPVGQGSNAGAYRRSLRCERSAGAGRITMRFGSSLSFAPYVVTPTRPHTIVPVNARMLTFTGSDGARVFARRVNHPGTRGNDFPKIVLTGMRPLIEKSLLDAIQAAQGG